MGFLIQWSSSSLDPMTVSAPRDFATHDLEHPTFGFLPCEPPSLKDPWVFATYPPRMDGPDPLATSPLATWSTQPLVSYLANLRVCEIPGYLPPILLRWTILILSRLFHSATWSTQPLGSYLANLQLHKIPGSLPPVLLK
jgi:hypothetical protein